jgi:hypothetical protein
MMSPEWTSEQNEVIRADVSERLIVNAGPGTGKTAVACARIAWLIDVAGTEPSSIWLISFTRTAVQELRNRIENYLSSPDLAKGIRISTLDAHAFSVQAGFNFKVPISGGYEQSINAAIRTLQESEGALEYLSGVNHIIFDEGQDIVGPRVELVLEIVNAISGKAGVTIFCDEAQAIYGFSKNKNSADLKGTLPENIRKYMGDSFKEIELTVSHRTNEENLLELYKKGRKILTESNDSYKDIKALIEEKRTGMAQPFRNELSSLAPQLGDAFVLFRKRGEALDATNYFGTINHRVRISNLPKMVHDWIGIMFWDISSPKVTYKIFDDLWGARASETIYINKEDAWNTLVRVCGDSDSVVDVGELARLIGSGNPPLDITHQDFGFGGPTIGTIHASKGREADHVRLYIPEDEDDAKFASISIDELNEEARALFVGATRARKELYVGYASKNAKPKTMWPYSRTYTPLTHLGSIARVEIGRTGDVSPIGAVGLRWFRNSAEVQEAQKRIYLLRSGITELIAVRRLISGVYAYAITDSVDNEDNLVFIGKGFSDDVSRLGQQINRVKKNGRVVPPKSILGLRCYGVTTLAIPPDSNYRSNVHPPWRVSGLMVAPLILGYPRVEFERP